jgi:hypothetical protein
MVELRSYIDILNPYKFREAMARELKNTDLKVTAVNFLFVAVLSIMYQFFRYDFLPRPIPSASAASNPFLQQLSASTRAFNPVGSVGSIAITIIYALLLPYLTAFMLQLVAKALGGNGRFSDMAYLNSIKAPLQQMIILPITLLMVLGTIGGVTAVGVLCLVLPVLFVFGIYAYYIEYKILRAVNPSLSRNRAIAGFIVAYLIEFVIVFAISYGRIFARL